MAPVIHQFRSRSEPGLRGYYAGCTCGWDPDTLLFNTPEAGERVWLDQHMRPEHEQKTFKLDGSGWMVSCKCGWIASDYQKSWEAAVLLWENNHYAHVKAERDRAEAEFRAAAERLAEAERLEVQRRVAELKQRFSKKR